MKKDIEWAKNRIKNTLKFEALNEREVGFKIAMQEALEIIDQLDESKTLSIDKEQLIKRIENYIPLHDKTVGDVVNGILEIVKQLPEMEVLSPEWIVDNTQLDMNPTSRVVPVFLLQNLLVPKQEEVDQAYKDGYEKGKQHATKKQSEETETVAGVLVDYLIASAKLKLALSMEIEELEE